MPSEMVVRDPGAEEGNVFLGDLPISFTEEDISGEFSSYGGKFVSLPKSELSLTKIKNAEILDCKIMRSEHTGKSLSYGFLKFASDAIAARVIEEKNGVTIQGRNLRCLMFLIYPTARPL